ncbi:hypothetical protein ACFJGW_01795 [Burkholderiaceae bacterium UC74_6]
MTRLQLLLAAIGLTSTVLASAGEIRLRADRQDDLVLDVPADWQSQLASNDPRVQLLRLQGKDPKAFLGLVTIMRGPPDKPPIDDARVHSLVEQSAKEASAQAVEPVLDLVPLRSAAGAGYYFSATDRAPKPGEYKFMTQGSLGIGRTLLMFTAMSNQEPEHYTSALLAMLATAKLSSTPAVLMLAPKNGSHTLVLPRGDWEVTQQNHRDDGTSAYFLLSSSALAVNFSAWIESSRACSDGDSCLRAALKNPSYLNRSDQKFFEDVGFKATSFYVAPTEKLPIEQFHVLASAYVNGYWIDIHISKADKSRPDPTAALAVLHSLQLQ